MKQRKVDNLRFYEIDSGYIEYLSKYAPHLYRNSKDTQQNERKYIGIVLKVNNLNYFAPLTSAKRKHRYLKEGIDLIKIKNYAVLNLNNMFPVPESVCKFVDFSTVLNPRYKDLLQAEYRYIKMIQEKIRKSACILYNHKVKYKESDSLSKRCNDYLLLEEKCKAYKE